MLKKHLVAMQKKKKKKKKKNAPHFLGLDKERQNQPRDMVRVNGWVQYTQLFCVLCTTLTNLT